MLTKKPFKINDLAGRGPLGPPRACCQFFDSLGLI
tara:strand:+ start:78 stop:182 length:105 start_codon:yes stop_codon:yes gene_type:complete